MIKYSIVFKDYALDKIEPYEVLIKQYSSLREYVVHECGERSWEHVFRIYAMHEMELGTNIFRTHEVINWDTLEECEDYIFTDECGNLMR